MKKILHLTLNLDIGGLERMILVLCRGQLAEGWNPTVFVYERKTGELLPKFEKAGIPVIFYAKGPGFSLRLPFQILSLLRTQKINLIHSHDLGALIYASLVRIISGNKIHVVHTQHSFQHFHTWKAAIYERIFPWIAERVVCVSEDLRRTYLRLKQSPERLRLVPNGVDFSIPLPSSAEKKLAKKKLIHDHQLAPELIDKKWIITLGRIAKVKGPQHALAIWNALGKEASRGAALLLVGPELEPGLVRRLHSEAPKDTHFPGPSLDPELWLVAADLFLSGAEFEGLPMAGLEARAAGLPMLLSQIPGHAIFTGLASFFPLHDPAAGAIQLELLLKEGNPGRQPSSQATIARLEATCGASHMAKRYLLIYKEICGG